MDGFDVLGLVGYGRFGAAFGGLLSRGQRAWRAFDPQREVAPGHACVNLADLAQTCDLIVLAVPVGAMDEVLDQLRPLLDPVRHSVIDVGSVKLQPCALLQRHLGTALPHAGTHPLFGPLSLARAEPLRTVLCPSPHHPATTQRVRALFESLGSTVLERSADEHDRQMALSHVLAFFIAKGLLQIGAGSDPALAPPSFRALAQAIDAVRADAGHLFATIQRENPFAAESRERLLASLRDIHNAVKPVPSAANTADALLGDGEYDLSLEAHQQLAEVEAELAALHQRRDELLRRTVNQ